jgi:hypothetical protein
VGCHHHLLLLSSFSVTTPPSARPTIFGTTTASWT